MSRNKRLPELIYPSWPVPSNVVAAFSQRTGGVSEAPFDSLNLSDQVGDQGLSVQENRHCVAEQLGVPVDRLSWLRQVHGVRVVEADPSVTPQADAQSTTESRMVCCILTADCLPVLFCDRKGTRVASAHAGWRGLAGGVLEETLKAFVSPGHTDILACVGVGIGQAAFEVGPEVRAAFIAAAPEDAAFFLESDRPGHYLCDLAGLAVARLKRLECAVFQIPGCTYEQVPEFFSYRRDGQTGRQGAFIYLK